MLWVIPRWGKLVQLFITAMLRISFHSEMDAAFTIWSLVTVFFFFFAESHKAGIVVAVALRETQRIKAPIIHY